MFKEFKDFAMRGNVLDMAVGVVIGGAFGKITTSLVGDVLMPPIGSVLGKVDFSGLFLNISGHKYASLAEAKTAGAATINYGAFLNTVVDFFIVAFAMFLVIRQANRFLKHSGPPATPTTKECPFCFSTIAAKARRCAFCTSELK